MENVVKSDVFFFVTTIAIAVVAIAAVAVFIYLILILRDIKNISGRVREEGKHLSKDISDLRRNIRTEGAKVKHFVDFFASIAKRNARNVRTRGKRRRKS